MCGNWGLEDLHLGLIAKNALTAPRTAARRSGTSTPFCRPVFFKRALNLCQKPKFNRAPWTPVKMRAGEDII